MAGLTGLEPVISGVTGQRSNQLNHSPQCLYNITCSTSCVKEFLDGTLYRIRTYDPLLRRQMLYPTELKARNIKYALNYPR